MLRVLSRRLLGRGHGSLTSGILGISDCRHVSGASTLKKDSQHVLSSSYPDIEGYDNVYLHEAIWRNMDRWADRVALTCAATGRSYTYQETRKLCGRLAMSLRKSNLPPGTTIALILPNIPEYPIVTLAASEAGLCTTLINPAFTVNEMKKLLANSNAAVIFTNPAKYADVLQSVEGTVKLSLPIVVINDGSGFVPPAAIKFEDMVRNDVEQFSETQKTLASYEDTVHLPFSSGTTGLPKGVELTHRNLAINLMQGTDKRVFGGIETTSTHQDVMLVTLPLFHIYGLAIVLYAYLSIGGKLVCVPKFSLPDYLYLLKKERPTGLHVVPPIIQMLAKNPDVTPDHFKSVRFMLSGAAPLGQETIQMFFSRSQSTIDLVQGYGLTETSPCVCVGKNLPADTCGKLVANTQMRIVGYEENNSGKNLGVNETGELYVRGPQVMKGYYKNPEATADVMDGEWLKTGDLGYYNEEGLIRITGRLKELIKVKGFQVPPAELEDVIRSFDKIQDVAVVGIPHEEYGEIPKAFVVRKKGEVVSEDDVKNFVADRVTKYKRLGYVEFIDHIPKSAAGKILRKELSSK